MDFLRELIERYYERNRNKIFEKTEEDPENAHEEFVRIARLVTFLGLENLLLNHSHLSLENRHRNVFISNAAGFNKNGEIPPSFLYALGFDRIVIGTVTADSYKGNPRPRIKRFIEEESMVNWMKFPGNGAEKVMERLLCHEEKGIPLTLNIMSTPDKKRDELLDDLSRSILKLRDVPYVDRFEINVSCPNARADYSSILKDILSVIRMTQYSHQDIYVKVSPDLDDKGVDETLDVITQFPVAGIVTSNTTIEHYSEYIPETLGGGGASGNAVYKKSLDIQKKFYYRIKDFDDLSIIACGGIDSKQKLDERLEYGAREVQIFTPLIYKGPRLLRELREFLYDYSHD